jgi:hypothetical protein
LSLGGGYHNSRYHTSSTVGTPSRTGTDESFSLSARLSTTFLKRGTIAGFYQYSDNSATQSGFSFTSHQVGIELGYRY